jgi:hypothetical protein
MYTYNRKVIGSDGKLAAVARCWVMCDPLAERAGSGDPVQVERSPLVIGSDPYLLGVDFQVDPCVERSARKSGR